MSKKETLKTASVLAFERKLDVSDALLAAGRWDERAQEAAWAPVAIQTKSVRGTISNRLKSGKDSDPAKLDAAIQSPNLQTVDVASLPAERDTLRVRFTLRVLGGTGEPNACNDADYRKALLDVVNGYKDAHGFGVLAHRYAVNLANGRFLWRNRMGAETVEVQVKRFQNGQAAQAWTFDALGVGLRSFPTSPELQSLAAVVEEGLSGNGHVLLEVSAYVRIGAGQEVFPSQELILDRGKSGKSKTLYSVNGVAALHSQKVGNALRTIDTWYPESEEVGPIAVEPYGSVTSQGKAYRQPKEKLDFYNLLDNWVLKGNAPADEQQHFVMACLIRGGVFGDSDK